jgi:glycosyltransferase involved in cell wall biosynthesis
MTSPSVSVIIPVLNDSARLRRCLDALAAQSYPGDCYEVLVVDNGSQDDVAALVASYTIARFDREPRPGSYAARNRGLALARGEVLAFTDSDCVPRPDWLERGVGRLARHPECGLVGGAIDVFFQDPRRPTPTELYERLTAFPQQKYVETYHYAVTANMFTRRAIFERVGAFNGDLASGGDREWGQRVHAAGLPLVYADDVQIEHPARRRFGELATKIVRVTGGMEQLRAGRRGALAKVLRAAIKDMIPPADKIRGIWTDRRLAGASQRMKVTGVLLGLRYVQAWARLRTIGKMG